MSKSWKEFKVTLLEIFFKISVIILLSQERLRSFIGKGENQAFSKCAIKTKNSLSSKTLSTFGGINNQY
jgi:hypothetical protein